MNQAQLAQQGTRRWHRAGRRPELGCTGSL